MLHLSSTSLRSVNQLSFAIKFPKIANHCPNYNFHDYAYLLSNYTKNYFTFSKTF